jgi:hypothetical protein
MISKLMQDSITPELEKRFDQLVSEDEVLRIGRLEIDLGEISETNLERQLPEKLIRTLLKAMGEELAAIKTARDKKLSGSRAQPAAEIKSLVEANIARLVRFLRTGYLEQSVTGNFPGGFRELLEELLESDAEATINTLHSEIKHADRIKRLIYQSPDSTLLTVLLSVSASEGRHSGRVRSVTEFALHLITLNRKSMLFGKLEAYSFRFEVWNTLFNPGFNWQSGASNAEMISGFLQNLVSGNSFRSFTPGEILEQLQNVEYSFQKGADGRRFSDDWIKDLTRFLRESYPKKNPQFKTGDLEIKEDFSAIVHKKPGKTNGAVKRIKRQKPGRTEDSAEEQIMPATGTTTGMIVRNAGLVLLYPFIPPFFRRTGLVDGKQFIDEDSKQRGVHLLQYLVNGETESPEEDLILNKVLCGMEPDAPLIPGIEILENETEESENLLVSLIDKWQALRNSSPGSVQSAFLQRDGIIRQIDQQNWKINVERKSVDVLLDKLPWGLSIFRMPWSETFIQADW